MKATRFFIVLIYTVVNSCASFASYKDSLFEKNAIIGEFLGHSLSLLSLNYEHTVYNISKTSHLSLRGGVGYLLGYGESNGKRINAIWSVPVVTSLYLGKRNNFFVLGVGYTASFGKKWIDSNTSPPTIFKGFESSFIISTGFRHYFKGNFIFGVYPSLVWKDNASNPLKLGWGFYIGQGLKKS